jgi:hypothetical protein
MDNWIGRCRVAKSRSDNFFLKYLLFAEKRQWK